MAMCVKCRPRCSGSVEGVTREMNQQVEAQRHRYRGESEHGEEGDGTERPWCPPAHEPHRDWSEAVDGCHDPLVKLPPPQRRRRREERCRESVAIEPQPLDVFEQGRTGGVAIVGVHAQTAPQHEGEAGHRQRLRQRGDAAPVHQLRDIGEQLDVVDAERMPPRRQLPPDDAKRKDVRAGIDHSAAQLFRRHVAWRTGRRADFGQLHGRACLPAWRCARGRSRGS